VAEIGFLITGPMIGRTSFCSQANHSTGGRGLPSLATANSCVESGGTAHAPSHDTGEGNEPKITPANTP